MNALDRLFASFDAIRSESNPVANDPPPWAPAEDVAAPVAPQPTPTDLQNRAELDRLGFKDKKNWSDVRADKEEEAAKLLEERLRASHANKLLQDRITYPNGGVSFKQDEEGMGKAYGDASYPGVYYDQNTRTMYVKGTVDGQDWWDNISKVPVWGDLKDSRRYQDAERAYNDLLKKGFPIDRVVGHSLGGSVALQQQKDKNIDFSRTFGAPVVDLNPYHRGTQERFRHVLDPVSMLDRGAAWSGSLKAYPHTYGGFAHLDNVTM
jgi:hypothetical protein